MAYEARPAGDRVKTDAQRLYERLGYRVVGSEPDEWDELAPDGTVVTHRAMCTILSKPLQ